MSKVRDIKDFNNGWFAVDNCEDGYGENETWVGKLGELGVGYEYMGGAEWEGITHELINEHARPATEDEIRIALTREAERKYGVPCPIKYLDDGRTSMLRGFFFQYDMETDSLYASEECDVVYHRDEWAEVEESDRLLDVPYVKVIRGNELFYDFKDHSYTRKDLRKIINFLEEIDREFVYGYHLQDIVDGVRDLIDNK